MMNVNLLISTPIFLSMTNHNFPRNLSISLNPKMTAAMRGYEEHTIDNSPTITKVESSKKHYVVFHIMSVTSSSDGEDLEKEVLEAALEADLIKEPKS
ncbi:hypothetical protein AMTR_s00080p00155280 [Amborella trichopoda]|uniref:Uncharacterized protein n=1 Tax=Amborella trichopoda TaxID=13333 RepID=W1PAJ1_AMBTC|nr:hypothetical protein AMTR_s00080p00155280 [Amborella trichopoda]